MSIAKKPLKPADFPVTAEGQKIKSRTASRSQTRRMQISLPTWPSALTTMKLGAKKISCQPNRLGRQVAWR